MLEQIDSIRINFNSGSLFLLNLTLAFIMFGIALQLRLDSFRHIFRHPKPIIIGLVSQFLLLPAATYGLVWLIDPIPSMALGMMLVAACPGGNISNFLSALSKSNVALSISLTTFSSVFAFLLTPLNLGIWASLHPKTSALLQEIHIDPIEMLLTVLFILGLPLIAGILFHYKFPKTSSRMIKPITAISLVIFIGFVVAAFASNYSIFLQTIEFIALIVFLHNLLALTIGYGFSRIFNLSEIDSRTISIETGIQNSGLGLALIFTFFQGMGGMALIAALWGIWHLISGLTISLYWARNPVAVETDNALSNINR